MNNARTSNAAAGSQTAAITFCGNGPGAPVRILTEGYDGSSWSTKPNMATSRYGAAGAGTSTAGLAAGGYISAVSDVTEEFTGEATAETITTS
jgi:hypothetical protein